MTEWPQDRIKRVVDLWNAGKSFREIGKELGITRSMVGGFKNRHGRAYGMIERAKPEKAPKPQKKASVTLAPVRTLPRPTLKPLPAPERKPQPTGKLRIFQLNSQTCRWPYGDKDFTFCGRTPKPGSSYCGHHHAKAHVKRVEV